MSEGVMSRNRFLLLYGSQTGQAQAIAEEIREKAEQKGFQPDLHCLSQSEKKFHLEKEPVFVVVVSTTGDGDAPDTANKFWRRLKKRTLPSDHLSSCKYALLGLGDTNYSNFCNMGKSLNKRFLDLGASQFYPPGFADDAVGLEIVVEPWIDGLWESLESVLLTVTGDDSSTATDITFPLSSQPHPHPLTDTDTSASKSDLSSHQSVSVESGVMPEAEEQTEDVRSSLSDASTQQKTDHTRNNVVQTSSDVCSTDLASSLRDRLNISPSLSSSSSLSEKRLSSLCADLPSSSPLLESQSGETVKGWSSVDGGSKRRRSIEEESSMREEVKTPSMELVSSPLTLPSIQPIFIKVLLKSVFADSAADFPFDKVQYALKTSVSMATLVMSRPLTREGAVKKTLELEFNIEDCPSLCRYQPGDAFGFICPNPASEVDWLLQRLNLFADAEKLMTLSILPDTEKRNPILPKHIPNPCSIVHFFTHCVDIRCVPKKAFLCYLSTCCSSWVERRRLEELSSRQGSRDYTRLVLEQRNDFLDILSFFPSCQPTLPRLVELLPRLQPRYYSAASSPLVDPQRLRVIFNVEELPMRTWLKGERLGLATGWFDSVAVPQITSGTPVKVPVFPRVLNPFHLPDDSSTPIVMIGPGTGVSPFIGFLEYRQWLQLQQQEADKRLSEKTSGVGNAWLFFGCRHPEKDYLYKHKLEGFVSTGVLTHLHVSFSRYSSDDEHQAPRYVQDNLRSHWEELAKWIMEHDASVFVCGDAKNMAKDINNALIEVLDKYLEVKPGSSTCIETGQSVIQRLKENKKYLVDAWG